MIPHGCFGDYGLPLEFGMLYETPSRVRRDRSAVRYRTSRLSEENDDTKTFVYPLSHQWLHVSTPKNFTSRTELADPDEKAFSP
jgi:hypothetical protein